jgi:release factor glutamine methyltransferase
VTALNINNRAIFRKSDIFEKIRAGETFDVIVSNPPYIPYGTELSKEVMYEPSLALFAEENGLAFYRKIIEQAPQYLNPEGYLMFELGIDEAVAVKEMMAKDFTDITVLKDFVEIDRVIFGKIKS